jgi:hypothetical protein
MRKVTTVLAYVMAYVLGGVYIDNGAVELGVAAVVAAAFSVSYIKWALGSQVVAIATVVVVTLVVPVLALMLIASPVHPSWWYSFKELVQVSVEHGYLRGLDWFLPLTGACVGTVVATHLPARQGTTS